MKSIFSKMILIAGVFYLFSPVYASESTTCPETLNFDKEMLAEDSVINLCKTYKGKVVMIVNTASYCGFTSQYKSLESLYEKYKDKGFVVLGFPSNDFGSQEPGSEEQIKEFCDRTYKVKFPMFEKTRVAKGTDDPLYNKLAGIAGEYPQWNFHKYLLDRDGKLIESIASRVDPTTPAVINKIESLL